MSVGADPSFDSRADEVREVVPYVTLRKTRDSYSWSICAPADGRNGLLEALKVAADDAYEVDHYIRDMLAEDGRHADPAPPRGRR